MSPRHFGFMMMETEQTHIYQSFWFDNKVKEHFYTGNAFLDYRKEMEQKELLEMAHDILKEGEKSFMPELVQKIESLLGEGNYIYDYWEFGPDCFSLYWWIKKTVYKEKMRLIRQWVEYEGLSEWVEMEIKTQGL